MTSPTGMGGSPFPSAKPTLPNDLLLHLYEKMTQVRLLDERAFKLQRSGRIGFLVMATGEEAAVIGTVAALQPEDWLFPSYRQVGALLYRGYSLEGVTAQLFGVTGDDTKGRQMPCHYSSKAHRFVSISSVIGTQIVQAAGCGMAARLRGEPVVTMAYLGDGATSANDFHAGLNFAGVYKAPVVFVCINNQYAISLPVSRQSAVDGLWKKAAAYGMHGEVVHGDDVEAVYVAARHAVDRARSGEGPTLLEILTYRRGPHSSSDDVSRYREDEEMGQWLDPLVETRQRLIERQAWNEADDEAMVNRLQEQINQAIRRAEQSAPPSPDTLFEDVYEDLPVHLRHQQQALHAEIARSGDQQAVTEAFPL